MEDFKCKTELCSLYPLLYLLFSIFSPLVPLALSGIAFCVPDIQHFKEHFAISDLLECIFPRVYDKFSCYQSSPVHNVYLNIYEKATYEDFPNQRGGAKWLSG
jgi:hypothetical protein